MVMTWGIVLDETSMQEKCCKNLYWALKMQVLKECVYFLGGQIMEGYKQLNKIRLKSQWLVEIQFLCFILKKKKKFQELQINVETSKSLNWKPKIYKNGCTISAVTDFATALKHSRMCDQTSWAIGSRVSVKKNKLVKESKTFLPVP